MFYILVRCSKINVQNVLRILNFSKHFPACMYYSIFQTHLQLVDFSWCTFAAILLYRICRCCRRIYVKLLHTVFHALTIPCVAIGFLAVLDSHNLRRPEAIPNFYSLHSWIGLVTMGLFAIQVSHIIICKLGLLFSFKLLNRPLIAIIHFVSVMNSKMFHQEVTVKTINTKISLLKTTFKMSWLPFQKNYQSLQIFTRASFEMCT